MSGWREEVAWAAALVACIPVLLGCVLLLPVACVLGCLLDE